MVVALAPFDCELAARQRDLHNAIGALQPGGSDRRRACRRTTGFGQPGATLPGADRDVVAVDDMGKRDIGALWKDRMVFQQRPETGENIGVDAVDPEDRV